MAIIYDQNTGTGILGGAEATFTFISEHKPTTGKSTDPGSPGTEPTPQSLDDPETNASTKYVDWGEGNDFPQKVIKEAYKVSVAPAALEFKVKAHYGTGLIMFKLAYDEENKKKIVLQNPSQHPEAKSFMKRSRINRYLLETINDLVWLYNAFPEMIVSRDFSKITSIRPLEGAFCRWAEQDEDERRIKSVGFSAMWPNPSTDEITDIPVIDPWWTPEETRTYLKKHKIWKFVFPIYNPTPGKTYYQEAPWNASRKSGWFDVAGSIPSFKKHLMKNQMTIKWHIEIPLEYWDKLFPDGEFDKKAKKLKIEAKLMEMDEFLSDTKNTGKAFVSHFAVDPITKQPIPGWKITAVENKLTGGEYLEDAGAANDEVLFSMRVDPSLIGHGAPGGKLGAGSGTDKLVAFNIYNALLKTDRDISVEPLEFIRDYNGWDEDLQFGFGDITLKTLDKNPTGSQNTINT